TPVAPSTVSAPQAERRRARTRCPCAIDGCTAAQAWTRRDAALASGAAEGAAMCDGGTVMSHDFTICVGTIGSGIWRSPDGGGAWWRVRPSGHPENDVRALAADPRDPHIGDAGTGSGAQPRPD